MGIFDTLLFNSPLLGNIGTAAKFQNYFVCSPTDISVIYNITCMLAVTESRSGEKVTQVKVGEQRNVGFSKMDEV